MKHVLVIDDDPDVVDSLIRILEPHDYRVTVAFNGDEGLIKAREERPDLIILDVMLPKMNGYYVCKTLKDDDHFASIPIIIFTARDHSKDQEITEEIQADAYLTKPFDEAELLAKVKKFL